jgi:hypothetical protein
MLHLRAVLGPLGDVTGAAEKLAFADLGHQLGPCSRQASSDVEALGRGVDVIELQVLRRAASDTAAAKHLDESLSSTVLVGLDVDPEVLGSPGHSS